MRVRVEGEEAALHQLPLCLLHRRAFPSDDDEPCVHQEREEDGDAYVFEHDSHCWVLAQRRPKDNGVGPCAAGDCVQGAGMQGVGCRVQGTRQSVGPCAAGEVQDARCRVQGAGVLLKPRAAKLLGLGLELGLGLGLAKLLGS